MAKDTAEAKLLKLIEETDAKDKAVNPAAAGSAASAGVSTDATKVLSSVNSVGVGAISLPPFLRKVLGLFSGGSQPRSSLRLVNYTLLVFIVAAGFFFVRNFLKGMEESQEEIVFEVKQKPFESTENGLAPPKDAGEYVRAISARNIFRPFEKKAEETKVSAPSENQQIKNKLTNFKLVGISWLSTPETATAMIEDKSRGETLFKKKGDDLDGVRVEVIYADRVEFSFQGEKLTINL